MLQKITGKTGRSEQMKRFAKEAEAMIEKYGWHNRTVMPYGYQMPVRKIIADCKDYDRCTAYSQDVLISLANGLTDILNAWEKDYDSQKVTVRHKATKKTYSIPAELADSFLKEDFELVESL